MNKMKSLKILLPLICSIILFTGFNNAPDELLPYKNSKLKIEERVNDLLSRMTLDEKLTIIGGTGFETPSIERLGIPELKMSDGPVGVRWGVSTAYPSGVSMAATWNPSLIYKIGQSIGRDTKAKGRNVILGPCVNIVRIPIGGRNFETFGEDPYLTSLLAVDYINGVQSQNVAATVKHFACNNQEYERDFVNVQIDERALNEIYLPSFKSAVTLGNVLCVMSSYNKVNGHYASENEWLLKTKLKDEWNFNGLVMSDWGAVHSTIPTYNNGLDIEMPTGKFLNKKELSEALKNKIISENTLNDKVKRILTVMFKLGMFDDSKTTPNDIKLNKEIALQTAKESIVLLQNQDNILPLSSNKYKTVAFIGPSAKTPRVGGGGSSMVNFENALSPFETISTELKGTKILFARGAVLRGDSDPIKPEFFNYENKPGIKAEYFTNTKLEGNPSITRIEKQLSNDWGDESPAEGIDNDNFSVRWTTDLSAPLPGTYQLDILTDDGIRVFVDGKKVAEDWTNHAAQRASFNITFVNKETHRLVIEYYEAGGSAVAKLGWKQYEEDLIKEAVDAASKSDLVLLFAGTSAQYESEGFDRDNIDLPDGQNALIDAVTKVNKNVIVVLSTGQPVAMPWKNKVKGIVETWFGGEEISSALKDVLFGKFNPSGKLPVTFPVKLEDCLGYSTYKKIDSLSAYSDGLFVGYRHFDKSKIEPLFPFGYGLSYTAFEYSNIKLSSDKISQDGNATISFTLTNKGKMDGSEIVQLYIKDVQSSVERPEKELKRFDKVFLKAGESKQVEFKIDKSILAFYDFKTKSWIAEPGEFRILIGSSSRDIKLSDVLVLK